MLSWKWCQTQLTYNYKLIRIFIRFEDRYAVVPDLCTTWNKILITAFLQVNFTCKESGSIVSYSSIDQPFYQFFVDIIIPLFLSMSILLLYNARVPWPHLYSSTVSSTSSLPPLPHFPCSSNLSSCVPCCMKHLSICTFIYFAENTFCKTFTEP